VPEAPQPLPAVISAWKPGRGLKLKIPRLLMIRNGRRALAVFQETDAES
jgi:hypothetical protein